MPYFHKAKTKENQKIIKERERKREREREREREKREREEKKERGKEREEKRESEREKERGGSLFRVGNRTKLTNEKQGACSKLLRKCG